MPAGCRAFTGGFTNVITATLSLPYSTVAVGPGIFLVTSFAQCCWQHVGSAQLFQAFVSRTCLCYLC